MVKRFIRMKMHGNHIGAPIWRVLNIKWNSLYIQKKLISLIFIKVSFFTFYLIQTFNKHVSKYSIEHRENWFLTIYIKKVIFKKSKKLNSTNFKLHEFGENLIWKTRITDFRNICVGSKILPVFTVLQKLSEQL